MEAVGSFMILIGALYLYLAVGGYFADRRP